MHKFFVHFDRLHYVTLPVHLNADYRTVTKHSYLYLKNPEYTLEFIIKYIHDISTRYNIDKKNLIYTYFNYVIYNYANLINLKYLDLIEKIIHNNEIKIEYIIKYFILFVKKHYHMHCI